MTTILARDEPVPYEVTEGARDSPFFITCDHAGRLFPRALGSLGLSSAQLETHIAWDIGAAAVARKLASLLGAWSIEQRYCRLIVDCNRPLGAAGSIPVRSEFTNIPANALVSPAEAEARAAAVFRPYHERIAAELNHRQRQGQRTIFIAMHTFTPVFMGVARPWHAGVLYNRDPRLGHRLLAILRAEPGLVIGDNEPYAVSDVSDYGVVEYGERRGLLHVELEVRQDLVSTDNGASQWAERLAGAIRQASSMFPE